MQDKKYNPIRGILDNRVQLRDLVKKAFAQHDVDQNGKLDFHEMMVMMKNILSSHKQEPSELEVRNLMKQLDSNDDGYISLDEFQVLMEHTLKMKAEQFDKANGQ